MANSRWSQSPSGSTSIRFRSRMVRGDGCSPPPFMWGPSIHRGKPVAELRLSSRGAFPGAGSSRASSNGPRGEHEKRRLQRTAFAKKQPPVIGSLSLYFYVNIYGYLIMQPSPPLLHLLRQGQACTQALSP